MRARAKESETIQRCLKAALGDLVAPADQREANVFRLASMILRPRFPSESGWLMFISQQYFAHHPSELIESAQIVRNGWVVSLPHLRDTLEHQLQLRTAASARVDMKVFLDDERPAPPGWIRVRWPDEAIALLKTGSVEEISLDHDLGDDSRGTGYDVIVWIEEAVALTKFSPPRITIHSANPSAADRMKAGVTSIERLVRVRQFRP